MVKLTPQQASNFAAATRDMRGILLFGPDEGLARERIKSILKSRLEHPEDPLSSHSLPADKVNSEPSLLFEALSSITLMGIAPVVTVEHATDKMTAHIKSVLATLECANFFIVCAGELGPRSSLRMLFEKEKTLAALGCYHDDAKELLLFIRKTLDEHKIKYEADAPKYLSSCLGNDRGVTRSELEKIILYLGEEKYLDTHTCRLLTGSNTEASLDDLCTAVLEGKCEETVSLSTLLVAEGSPPISQIRALGRHIERLRQAQSLIKKGISAQDAMKSLKPPVFYKHQPVFSRHISRLSEETLSRMNAMLLGKELQMKRNSANPLLGAHALLSLASALGSGKA